MVYNCFLPTTLLFNEHKCEIWIITKSKSINVSLMILLILLIFAKKREMSLVQMRTERKRENGKKRVWLHIQEKLCFLQSTATHPSPTYQQSVHYYSPIGRPFSERPKAAQFWRGRGHKIGWNNTIFPENPVWKICSLTQPCLYNSHFYDNSAISSVTCFTTMI